ncbi:MAG: cation:proton antiporter [Candidatus Korarchaeota archaeon]|nr:cation:proton antiporter [Candidatus Korarchaeota archaeon]NIU85350.1 hypothetical protein [Candidatus Thorarchaeota archaeon]NIW15447.1 hypothetical protein [Candidatus Thorarchaeota archaeon]NIW53392.1 hypothetical protein [Candidatus Korarchaeota archaeon]
MTTPILHEPSAVFLVLLIVLLLGPLLSKKVRLPEIVGLILGGMIIGMHGLNLLETGPLIGALSTVGLLYLMFNCGLELDLQQFKNLLWRSIFFATVSLAIPLLSAILIGRVIVPYLSLMKDINFSLKASLLLGSIYGSQTLLAYPVLRRLGVIKNEAVSLTVGATIITDTAALFILAIITGAHNGGSFWYLPQLGLLTLAYIALLVLLIPRLAKHFMRRYQKDAVKLQFILLIVFMAGALAELIGLHPIIGAFLAGLALNSTLPEHSRIVKRVLFIGNTLFIPLFMLSVGMRLNPLAFFELSSLLLGIMITVAVYTTKFTAAWITKSVFHYSRPEFLVMWGISQAQAAATLATVLVGMEVGIFSRPVFNAAILTVLFTSITSPFITQRYGTQLETIGRTTEEATVFDKILVPLMDPNFSQELMDLAGLLTRTFNGRLLPLTIASEKEKVETTQTKVESTVRSDPETKIESLTRIDSSLPKGILHEAAENEASMILLELSEPKSLGKLIFDETVDCVLRETSIPTGVCRLRVPPQLTPRIVFVVGSKTIGTKFTYDCIYLIRDLASALGVPVLILATPHYVPGLRARLGNMEAEEDIMLEKVSGNLSNELEKRVTENDLVVLTTMGSRKRFRARGEHIPYKLLESLDSSLIYLDPC